MAAGGSAGTLYVKIAAQTDKLNSGLRKARSEIASFTAFSNRSLAKLGLAFGAGFGIEQFASSLLRTAEAMDATGKAAERLGVGTEALVGLQHGAELSGVSAESLQSGLTKLNKAIGSARTGSEAALKPFTALGIKLKDIEDIPLDQALGKIADSLNGINNAGDRTRIAMELFGRGGAPLLSLLKEGSAGMKAFQADAEKLGITFSSEEFARVEKFNDELERLKKMLGGAMQGLVIDITPAALKLVEDLQKIAGSKRDDSFQGLRVVPGGLADRIISFFAGGGDVHFGQSAGIGQRRMDGIWGEMFRPQVTENTPRKPPMDFNFFRSTFGAAGSGLGRMGSLFGRNLFGLFGGGGGEKEKEKPATSFWDRMKGWMTSGLGSALWHNLFTGPNTTGRAQSKAWREAQKEAEAERLRKLQERHPALRRESNAALELGTREASIAARGSRTDYMREVSRTAKEQLREARQTNDILRKGQGVVPLAM